MKKIPAKQISYSNKKREKKDIKYIVIHYTGNDNDTAEGNANYFKNVNTREAGAHFFVDQNGVMVKSIDLNRTAWAVGGAKYNTGGGRLYGEVTNANSVSIELCDIKSKDPSDKMMKGVCKVIKYIQKYCPNAKTIIRHYDVNGKPCPLRMISEDDWTKFQLRLLKEFL